MSKIEYSQQDVREALKKPGDGVPIFYVSSLGEYCEVTDLIRIAWKDKVNERQKNTISLDMLAKSCLGFEVPDSCQEC